MNLNVLKPGQAIASAFEKPNPGIAIALVFVASIIALVQGLVFGAQLDIGGFVMNVLLPSYIGFFVLAILIYIIAFILKGRAAVSGTFSGIISALGLLWIPIIVGLLISFVAIPAIFSPLALELAKDVGSGKSTTETLVIQIRYLVENDVEVGNLAAAYAFGAVFALIALFNLYLLYKIISRLFQYRILGNIIVMVVTLIILGLLPF